MSDGFPALQWAERLAVLELKVKELSETNQRIESKLDDLLQLKSKGMGAFWLASTLLGTGIIGFVLAFIGYFKGH